MIFIAMLIGSVARATLQPELGNLWDREQMWRIRWSWFGTKQRLCSQALFHNVDCKCKQITYKSSFGFLGSSYSDVLLPLLKVGKNKRSPSLNLWLQYWGFETNHYKAGLSSTYVQNMVWASFLDKRKLNIGTVSFEKIRDSSHHFPFMEADEQCLP